jgi:hypothetical protein
LGTKVANSDSGEQAESADPAKAIHPARLVIDPTMPPRGERPYSR